MSMNRERYVICTRRELGSLTDPENKTIHSEVFTVKQREERASAGSIPGSYYRGCGSQGSPGSQLTVDRVCHVPRKSMSSTYVAPKECERRRARAATRLSCRESTPDVCRLLRAPWMTFKRMHAFTDFSRGFSCHSRL